MKKKVNSFIVAMGSLAALAGLQGCWVAAAGAGAEAAYVTTQDDRTSGETFDDQLIVSSIKTKMIGDPVVDGLDINVDSMRGNVTLKGFVKDSKEATRAIEIAQSVSGVKTVQSKLIID